MKVTKDSFIIITTPSGGRTVRWKHNNAVCKRFHWNYNPASRAESYVEFLVKELSRSMYPNIPLGKV